MKARSETKTKLVKNILNSMKQSGRIAIARAPEGFDARLLARAADDQGGAVLFVARDDIHMAQMESALAFFAPRLEVISFPAWDCLPYDRASPRPEIVAARVDALTRLIGLDKKTPALILTTVASALQRVPQRASFENAVLMIGKAIPVPPESITAFAEQNGYQRTDTVMEPGEYAQRGGILDIFPPGSDTPFRLDFFGDEVESIRIFDAATQRTTGHTETMTLKPVSELLLTEDSVSRFRSQYRKLFGAAKGDDILYESISEGRRHIGMEHWVALFHEKMETLFDYLADAPVFLDHQVDDAVAARLDLVAEYYTARLELMGKAEVGGAPYNPVPPDHLYLTKQDWAECLGKCAVAGFSPFGAPEGERETGITVIDAGGAAGRDFSDVRVQPDVNVFDALSGHVSALMKNGLEVIVVCVSEGSRARVRSVLAEHGLETEPLDGAWEKGLGTNRALMAIADIERGFVGEGLCVITEQDVLGERLIRRVKSKVRAEDIIAEASELEEGDLVVHADHGIGRYEGLVSIEVQGAPHDCLKLVYHGDDKLFLPVENIELITRYGSGEASANLDRLGGAAWQARKAHMKARLKDMADELIKIAAVREMKECPNLLPDPGAYDEFSARFPYVETDDQKRAIDDTVESLGQGRPMDRLVCGDVGFGKTEVALRAAFTAALSGKQVAVVVPTTLLARQHFKNFKDRFQGFPVRVEQISRLVSVKDVSTVKEGMADGTVDIVIGTHALLAKDVKFRDIGLLIIDEEQHFGVAHKEKLKQLKSDVHVLTLTATPIPRTLQLALTGVKEMSLIATPPVDRLAVRTFVLPFDPVVIREAIQRERFRGGQVFYVCPRIEDLDGVAERLKELAPDSKVVTAHGRLSPKTLEERISAFYDGKFDILLSTNIIESGLDLPTVNTIIIHRADMFGLAQLYQLRGRVGRGKVRAYAYLTLPVDKTLTGAAEKRLEVMQTLDTLGAGFTLASHDLDIRGAGNLLGAEQSGHIREVGIELYQQMLEEAVSEARGGAAGAEEDWSPQLGIGLSVLIPESYVEDLSVRLGLYRRAAHLKDRDESEGFAAELIDRFGGPLPSEVENLLETVQLKRMCKQAGVEKLDAGPKGAVLSFRGDTVANPAGLVAFIQDQAGTAKLRPDQKLVLKRPWENIETRVDGVRTLMTRLAEIAAV